MTTPSEPGDGRPDASLSAIMSERRQLINLSYRLLGSLDPEKLRPWTVGHSTRTKPARPHP